VLDRNDVRDVITLIEAKAPRAFYMVEDVKRVNEGIFPANKERRAWKFLNK
jgi:hypothetical protein